jgi:hypothetical protein
VKTTLEIPDYVFQKAKVKAAQLRIPLRQFITEAVEQKLAAGSAPVEKPWMDAFGKLKHLHKETERINRIIEEEFEQIEPEDRL